jgi:hypothetical protein
MLYVFSNVKSFSDKAVGNLFLNRCGLHIFRIVIADIIYYIKSNFIYTKKSLVNYNVSSDFLKLLKKDGYVVMPNFFNNDDFDKIYHECKNYTESVNRVTPFRENVKSGTGHSYAFKEGVDRYDGATVNRLLPVHKEKTPFTWQKTKERLFQKFLSSMSTKYYVGTFDVCQNIHGDDTVNHDVQKDLHKDTFHHTFKAWLYLEDVADDDGPFNYIPQSHKMTWLRIKWEYRKSIEAAKNKMGGAFRVTENDLKQMHSLPIKKFSVKKNTLLIANTRGFHCRGNADAYKKRFSLYLTLRPEAYKFY